MAYPVVRTDLMQGTNDESLLRTFKYLPSDTATAVNNGCVVKLNGLLLDSDSKVPNREVWKAVAVAANDALKNVVLVCTPELLYDPRLIKLSDFRNEAGALCRGYIMAENDIFSVTPDAFSATPATVARGNIVELAAGNQMKVVESLTSGSTKVGEVIDIETVGELTYIVIRVC